MVWPDIKRGPKNGVFSLVVQDIRTELLRGAFDPNAETGDGQPRGAAHTLIVDCGLPRKQIKAARRRLATGAKIVHRGSEG